MWGRMVNLTLIVLLLFVRMEAVMAYLRYYASTLLQGQSKARKISDRIASLKAKIQTLTSHIKACLLTT
jgi:hypothetical protein